MKIKVEKNSIEYYQDLKCFSYYKDGNLNNLKTPISIQMIALTESGMIGITSNELKVNDVLMLNIHVGGLPFDKLMANIKAVSLIGEMYKMEVEFMGMPNALFECIKGMLTVHETEKYIMFDKTEIDFLDAIVKKIKR